MAKSMLEMENVHFAMVGVKQPKKKKKEEKITNFLASLGWRKK